MNEYEIRLEVFARVLNKKAPGKLHFTSVHPKKLVRFRVIYTEGGKALSR